MSNNYKEICFCLLLIGIVIAFCFHQCKTDSNEHNKSNLQHSIMSGKDLDSEMKSRLTEEDSLCLEISLETGAKPYADQYGVGYNCPYSQCSGIRVTAPVESDIIVIIKRDNEKGKVVQHGFIRKGETLLFDIQDGVYQAFFYYGKGWNANKPMKNGIKGGFVTNEDFSKDEPQRIESGILEYILQLQRDGNFQTEHSDKSEMF